MDGLVETGDLALAIGNTSEGGGREESEGSRNDRGLVGEDVAEQVLGFGREGSATRLPGKRQARTEEDTVELARVGADDHSGRVDELVVNGDVGELLGHGVGDGLPPQPRGGQDVGLVDRVDGKRRAGQASEVGAEAGDPLNLLDRVGALVPSDGILSLGSSDDGLLAVPKVDTTDQLADDDDGSALGDVSLEGRVGDERRGREVGGADVGVEAERLAKGEQSNLGTEGRVSSPLGSSDSTCTRKRYQRSSQEPR